MTLKQLFEEFGHDKKWHNMALSSAKAMVGVYLRKLGNNDIDKLTDFDYELQWMMSEQPEGDKVRAKACLHYLLKWAKENGKCVAQIEHPIKKVEKKKTLAQRMKEKQSEPIPHPPPPEPKPTSDEMMTELCEKSIVNMYDSFHVGRLSTGTIYHDTASHGIKSGRRIFKDCWRAEITIGGQRYRHRSKDRLDCEEWLKSLKEGKIKPTDNKADWWRMEQRKDEAARIDEIIVNAAEESAMLYEYHQTGDISRINEYLTNRLLPHMAYYCARTLNFGKERMMTASRQAAALLLTRITAGKPVLNFTATCKRMLRVHKERGNFFYYENAPEPVKMMVNKMDLSGLAEVWKVTKDRRI